MKPICHNNAAFDITAVRERLRSARGPRYWRSLDEVARTQEFVEFLAREFPRQASEWLNALSRRRFLKLMGTSLALAGLTVCTRQPPERIVPYIQQPEEIVPGKPLFFATAMTLGGFASGLLVESHEGHPTNIEGNPEHPMSLGASNVFHQASLLDLYDPDRSQAVVNNGNISSWAAFLSALHDALEGVPGKNGAGLRILTETVTSPTLHAQLNAILEKLPEARWHQFEPVNRDNVRRGSRLAFGEVFEAQYHFDKARVVLALDSDFMFAHPAGLRYTRDFTDRRRVSAGHEEMNRLYVVERAPTVTGSNADHRLALPGADIEALARTLAVQLGAIAGPSGSPTPPAHPEWINALASDLHQNRGQSIVIVGESQPPIVHALGHTLNQFLGNVGQTIHYTASAEAQPVDQLESLRSLVDDLRDSAVHTLVILGGNPAYNAPADFEFARHLAKARLRIHLSPELNETSALCQWHIPQNHYLESWSDARAYDGATSLIQPLILPLYAGKSAHELLDALVALPGRADYDIVRDHWKNRKHWAEFEKGWRRALHDGVIAGTALPARQLKLRPIELPAQSRSPGAYEIVFQPDPTIGDGRFANNGWLQELAKPVTKLTWDNAALVSPATAEQHSLANGDVVALESAGRTLSLPIWITPGHAERSIGIYLGYGRSRVGHVGRGTGVNAFALRTSQTLWSAPGVKLSKTGGRYQLVTTQTHHTIDSEERQVYRAGTLREFLENPDFVRHSVEHPDPQTETLFDPKEHQYDGYHWGMSIDLTACIGCNACVLACQSENNIPVVGKQQVAVHRELQWIRIDTCFSGELDAPVMSHQPVPCMH
jgi:molybdopterin-containing oxidoreductase family iron-sulfur binding subunit